MELSPFCSRPSGSNDNYKLWIFTGLPQIFLPPQNCVDVILAGGVLEMLLFMRGGKGVEEQGKVVKVVVMLLQLYELTKILGRNTIFFNALFK